MRNKAKYLVCLLLFLMGCSKRSALPDERNEDPVFFFKGKVDGEMLAMQAGDEGMYMFSSFHQQADGVYLYQGDLRSASGTGDYALTVKINDTKVSSPNAAMDPSGALHTGPYLLRNQSLYPTTRQANFIPQRANNSETFEWEISSHPDSVTTVSSYSFSQHLQISKTYSITLKFDDNVGSCQTVHRNVFHVGNAFQATITSAAGNAPNSFQFKALTDQPGEYSYLWQFGDGSSSAEREPSHTYQDDQSRTVRLSLINSRQDSCIVYHQASVKNNYLCHANFNALFLPADLSTVFKTIEFELKRSDGKTYSSANAIQPSGTFAEVTSVTDYSVNHNGEKTKKLAITFNCLLKGPDKDIRITDAQAVIAVSYR